MNFSLATLRAIQAIVGEVMDRLLRKAEVVRIAGVSYSTLWRWQQEGLFPKPRTLCPNVGKCVAWLESEILEWLEKVKKSA